MKIVKILPLLIVMLIAGTQVQAQKDFTKVADQAYDMQQYSVSIDLYKKAYSKIKNKVEKARIIFQIAQCYRLSNNPKQAEAWFKKAVKISYEDPIAILYYADALKAQEKYADAIIQYDDYKKAEPSDPRGLNGSESCKLAQSWVENPTRYEVDNFKLVNSKENDFSPYFYDKKYNSIIYTSSREGSEGNDIDAWTGQSFTDLFFATRDKKGKWSKPQPVGEPINSKFNEGGCCLNSKCNTLYFTRCEFERKQRTGCQIFFSTKKGIMWDEPILMDLATEDAKSDTTFQRMTFGHPAMSDDELTLYYASDMPGGQGGKDIWKATRKKKRGDFTNPTNLGPVINTPGDEMFPYVHDNGDLYFSSTGHLGMGGLDIFHAEKKGDGFAMPENMKYPINSSGDDFGIIFEGNTVEKGFLTSNRKGGRGGDDIYEFILPPLVFTLKGVVTDENTKEVIPGCIVKLVGSDGIVAIDTTDATGLYSFDKDIIKYYTSYDLTFSKTGYFGKKGKETTVGLERSTDLIHDKALVPIPVVPIVLPDILYDFDKWDLKPQFHDSLNDLYQTLTDNPQLVIELSSHTDARGDDAYNERLSQRRAQSCVDYLVKVKGIEPGRIVPKGYGEYKPRTLNVYKNLSCLKCKGKFYSFEKGTKLTEKYINGLGSEEEKEAAHQLNRRTEFRILREDYISTKDQNKDIQIEIIKDDEREGEGGDDGEEGGGDENNE
ncbi:MAG: OmpA family protein [Bacteroidetes bacterium]|nr:OmpA family protein [Bacteroidota bacterium]